MPNIGDKGWQDGPTYGASAAWNENVTSPPVIWQLGDGYTVIDYQDQRSSNFGHTSLNVSYIQANGVYASTADVQSMYQEAINAAVQAGDSQYAASLQSARSGYLNIVSSFAANRNTISVTATASGSGNPFNQTGGSIQGKLRLQVMFLGTPASIQQASQAALAAIPFAALAPGQHGSIDLNRWCNAVHGPNASAILENNNVDGWVCRVGGTDFPIDVLAAAKMTYGPNVKVAYSNFNDPGSWYAYM